MKTVLFISHDASRTGAPILLLRLIKQIVLQKEYKAILLLQAGGVLQEEFEVLGKTYVWNIEQGKSLFGRVKDKLLRLLRLSSLTTEARHKKAILKETEEADIVFNNTVVTAHLLKELSLKGKKVYNYFHEMEVITEGFAAREDLRFACDVSEKIFVPSLAVKQFLKRDYEIPEEKFALLKYIIPESPSRESGTSGISAEPVVPADKFLIGLAGTLHWRKGYEYLPLLVRSIVLLNNARDVHFVWIGANKKSLEYKILKHDLRKLKLEQYVTVAEPVHNINGYLSHLDLFVLPSREDAFPLVVLEAAAFGVPCICFSQSGGMPEFVEDDAGIVVDYLDVENMAKAIMSLIANPERRRALGERAREKVREYTDAGSIVSELVAYLK